MAKGKDWTVRGLEQESGGRTLHELLGDCAWRNRRSLNSEIVAALWAWVGQPERAAAPKETGNQVYAARR